MPGREATPHISPAAGEVSKADEKAAMAATAKASN